MNTQSSGCAGVPVGRAVRLATVPLAVGSPLRRSQFPGSFAPVSADLVQQELEARRLRSLNGSEQLALVRDG
jgi:hypothetical protein